MRTTQPEGFFANGNGADMDGIHRESPYLLSLLFLGTIALSALLWWTSGLTAGPEYGGRYDVPAVNGAAWFGFLASIPALLVVGGLWMADVEKWLDTLRRNPHAGEA